jgi:exopolyphosphatase / guanosine-5'-triphosphate,3'-diphosphate pyrophosphatase
MNLAVIDLGTNTFHLMVVNVRNDGTYTRVYKTKTAVKLGKGGITEGIIAPDSFERGVSTIVQYRKIIDRLGVRKVFAFGTSAIRSAENGPDFIDEVKELTGIEIRPISGEEEAEYICHGVWEALDIGDEISLIIDIGGGSIEFIVADSDKIYSKFSYNIGVARMLEKFQPADPVTDEEVLHIESYLEHELKDLFVQLEKYSIRTLIGSSGSFDTFAEMIVHRYNRLSELKGRTEYQFDMNEFSAIHRQLLRSTVEERKSTKGIILMRVDMIVLASIFVNFIIRRMSIQKMRLSTYALKEGVIARLIKNSAVIL